MGRVTAPVSHRRRAGCTRNSADSIWLLDNTGTGTCGESSCPQAFVVDTVSGKERETGECRRRFRWYERPAGIALAEVQLPIVRVIVCNPDSMHVRFGQEPLTAVSLCASKVETRYFAIHQVHRALVGRLVRGQDAVVGAECIPTAEHNTLSIGRQLGKDSVGRVLNDRRRDGVVPRRWPVRVDDLLAERPSRHRLAWHESSTVATQETTPDAGSRGSESPSSSLHILATR